MAHQKNNDKKMDHIRKILDNPYQVKTVNNKYESTLKARLLGEKRYQPSQPRQMYSSTHELKPMVTIHKAQKPKPLPTQPVIEKTEEQKEITDEPSSDELFLENEDLFEIEPESTEDIPVFIEVKQKERPSTQHKDTELDNIDEESEDFKNLPKWEPVVENAKTRALIKEKITEIKTETNQKSEQEKQAKESYDEKFEEVSEPSIDEKTMIWQTVDASKEKQKAKSKKKIFQKTKKDKVPKKPRQKSKFFKSYKKEIEDEPTSDEPRISQEKHEDKLETKDDKSPFYFKDYQLYEKEIDLGNGKKRTIRFFSKDAPDDAIPTKLPKNYEVKINKKTGVPYLRKKQK